MEDLIKARQIMLKHGDVDRPTHCEHDELHVYPNNMDFTDDEITQLDDLGFFPTDDGEGFMSFKFGSC